MRIVFASAIVLFAGLGACSKAPPPPPPTAAAQPAQPPDKTVFDTQLKALQKAKDVQKTVDQQQAAQDKALKDAGG